MDSILESQGVETPAPALETKGAEITPPGTTQGAELSSRAPPRGAPEPALQHFNAICETNPTLPRGARQFKDGPPRLSAAEFASFIRTFCNSDDRAALWEALRPDVAHVVKQIIEQILDCAGLANSAIIIRDVNGEQGDSTAAPGK
jgi:hypothetical protein